MKKILILNSELGTQMQIYLALCDAYKVEIAENIQSVMYQLRKMRPEILLLDYNLEELTQNGKTASDLVRKVKKKYENLKVVLIVDDETPLLSSGDEAFGADSVLCRPIQNRNLITNVNKLATTVTGSLVS